MMNPNTSTLTRSGSHARRAPWLRTTVVLALATLVGCSTKSADNPDAGQPDGGTGEATPYVERIQYVDKDETAISDRDDIPGSAIVYVGETDAIAARLSDLDRFVIDQTTTGADGLHHVRMDQVHNGIRVWGAELVVHATDEAFRGANGSLIKDLEGFDITPELSDADVLASSQADYATRAEGTDTLEYSRVAVELVIYPFRDFDIMLAWHVSFYTELQAGIEPGLWNYIVDAVTGDVLRKYNALDTAVVQASGASGNAKVTRTWDKFLDVEDLGDDRGRMETDRLLTIDMENKTSGRGTVVEGDIDDIGDAAINDAHGFGEVTLNMMLDWYGYESLDDDGFLIKSRVHYGRNYENAFWDGTQMTYGDGDTFFYPLSGALDVVAHEFHHGFTTFHSGLVYDSQSGGLNESFSDIAGTIAEFYHEAADADWDLGGDVFRQPDGALRYMCDPPRDGRSIGHFDDYEEGMDVHYSSGISNKAFCLTAGRFAGGSATVASVRKAGQAWYEANANYWTSTSTFEQGCQGVVDAAKALDFSDEEVETITTSWAEVGVHCENSEPPVDCDEVFTADSGSFTTPRWPRNYPRNADVTWCIRPDSGRPVTLTFDSFETERNYDFVEIKNENGNTVSKTSGRIAPEDVTSSAITVTFTSDWLFNRDGFEASWGQADPGDGGTDGGTDGGGSDVIVYSDLSAEEGGELPFEVDVPAGAANVSFKLSDGSGDADLYIKRDSQPTTRDFDERSWDHGNDELVDLDDPAAGTYHIMVHAYASFSGVTLTIEIE